MQGPSLAPAEQPGLALSPSPGLASAPLPSLAPAEQPDLAPALPASLAEVGRVRLRLADGAATTLHVAEFAADAVELRVALLGRPQPLAAWCAGRGVADAIIGGYFARPDGRPLGDVRTRGIARRSIPFDAPWDAVRSCVHVVAGRPSVRRRDELPAEPRGDLLQAGPLLVADGRPVLVPGADEEGFSAGAHQFDSDITAGRHPRAALALAPGRILAVACDGRARSEAGLTLDELAAALADLGAERAINLDGGGSTSLVCGGELRNRPRDGDADGRSGTPIPGGRPISTALVFLPR